MNRVNGSAGRISMMLILALMLASFVGWAAFFHIDESVRASGQVISASRTQIVQAVDGGVLSRLNVREGDRVKEGQLLASLDPERFEAGYKDALSRVMALEASLVRLRAEVDGAPLVFDQTFAPYPDVVAAQKGLYAQRKRSLDEQISVLKENLLLVQDELESKERLYKDGDVSRMEMLKSRMQMAEVRGRMADLRNRYLQESRVERARVQEDLASQKEKLVERQAIFNKTELHAPLDGVVKLVRVTTIGGVLKPGDEILQIAPQDSDLLLEVKVPPADIGRLKPGSPASVKLDAFDFSIYGAFDGELIYISPDTLTEQGPNGAPMTYYRAQIRIEERRIKRHVQDVRVLLGMTATVDINVGSRTVLSYLAKPLVKTLGSAMTER